MRNFIFSIATALLLFSKGMQMSLAADALPVRVVQIDLDYVYDPDPDQLQQNLDRMVERIAAMKITAVFLQAFADPEGTGLASALYFPNSKLPMRADLFARAVTALQTGANVKVYGWLPVLSYEFNDGVSQVLAWKPTTGRTEPDAKAYRRVSPFDMQARADVIAVYEDMAKSAPLDGLLFHDDALLSDFEDASPAALAFYAHAKLPGTIKDLRASPASMQRWTEFKTAALVEFTLELAQHVRQVRPNIQTVRNMYANVALEPASEAWYAQNYPLFLKSYDYTALMAMPQMEDVPDDKAADWMKQLVAAASHQPGGLQHTIFELQSVDWRKQSEGSDRAISAEDLSDEMHLLLEEGAANFGYYPDDYVTNTPNADILTKDFSLPTTAVRP